MTRVNRRRGSYQHDSGLTGQRSNPWTERRAWLVDLDNAMRHSLAKVRSHTSGQALAHLELAATAENKAIDT